MYRTQDNLFGHLAVHGPQPSDLSRSFHKYKNSSTFDLEHSDRKIQDFKRDHNSRNVMASFSKTLSNYNDFSCFDQLLPKHIKQTLKDTTPGMRYFGVASGYSPLRRKIDRDYELSPNFTSKGRRPEGISDSFRSSILI